jgi:xylan 1,4-beta-xylosidase
MRFLLATSALLIFLVTHAQQSNPNPWVMAVDSSLEVTFKNPVLPGFYSDPSVCRVGEDYYLVTSSFEFFPGVPIFHSKDLINWQQIGNCLHRKDQLPDGINIFAPTLRYHDGVFYMITTTVTGEGSFYVSADDPKGTWSDPIFVEVDGIDPDLFFDEEGRSYVITNSFELVEVDIKTGQLIGEKRKVWNGTGGRYPEGPHIYYKDGFYYLMASEGGTEEAHMVTIARSHDIWGPYIENPSNPIIAHATVAGTGKVIQGVGHADLVQGHDDSWWVVFHGYRSVAGYPPHHILGRETCLAPVVWPRGGWPTVNGNGSITTDMRVRTLPQVEFDKTPSLVEFDEPLGFEWNYIQSPIEKRYDLNTKKGTLSLTGSDIAIQPIGQLSSPTFLGRRLTDSRFQATTRLLFDPKRQNEEAGLILYHAGSHFDLMISTENSKRYLFVKLQFGQTHYLSDKILLEDGYVDLRIIGLGSEFEFSFSQQGRDFAVIEKADARFLSTETLGWFTGVMVGFYATGNGEVSQSKATYDWFEYKNQ